MQVKPRPTNEEDETDVFIKMDLSSPIYGRGIHSSAEAV